MLTFFDCNTRIGRANHPDNSPYHDVPGLLESMRYYGIARSLVYHKQALVNPVQGNAMLLAELAGQQSLTPCAVLGPADTGEFGDPAEYVASLVRAGVRAVRFFPAVHHYSLLPFVMGGMLDAAASYNLPVLIDCIDLEKPNLPNSNWTYSPDYERICALAQLYPQLPFIVIMPGMQTMRDQCALLAHTANVRLEASSFIYQGIELICRRFGAGRLVYGSYAPILSAGAFASYVSYADIGRQERQQIASGNLTRLIGEVRA